MRFVAKTDLWETNKEEPPSIFFMVCKFVKLRLTANPGQFAPAGTTSGHPPIILAENVIKNIVIPTPNSNPAAISLVLAKLRLTLKKNNNTRLFF